ncbi:MAG: hypothetical protein K2H86_06860 [Muribaculaceae bacterium]|nr:hypothetical protein [Muribaculaceae bacterium]
MRKCLFQIVIGTVLAIMTVGCKQPEHDSREEGARQLYKDLVAITALYTDSIVNASDSTDLTALYLRYEKAYDNINNNVAPDTDLFMKEGENDTIILLQQKLRVALSDKLSSQDMHLASDTIEGKSESHIATDK